MNTRSLASLITLVLSPLLVASAQTDTLDRSVQSTRHTKASATINSKLSGQALERDKLDRDLERLIDSQSRGYTQRGTSPYKPEEPMSVPDVPDSVYISKLNGLPSILGLQYNALIRRSIETYVYKRRALVSKMLSQADLYFPDIETILDKNGLPLELKYLTIIESALNPEAVSPMGASGLWQLMLPTGRSYGLQINSLVDERFDPIRSTEAACKLLKELYKIYGNWWLVIAAYNCGSGNVNRAIKRAGSNVSSFWSIYNYLPAETRNYIPLFIGAYYALYYHKDYGIEPRNLDQSLALGYYPISTSTTFDKLSALTEVDRSVIARHNPHFRKGIIPGHTQTYSVRIPLQAITRLEDMADSIGVDSALMVEVQAPAEKVGAQTSKGKASKLTYHKVKRGETLASIARRYGTTPAKLKRWNGMKRSNLRAGQRIIVGQP